MPENKAAWDGARGKDGMPELAPATNPNPTGGVNAALLNIDDFVNDQFREDMKRIVTDLLGPGPAAVVDLVQYSCPEKMPDGYEDVAAKAEGRAVWINAKSPDYYLVDDAGEVTLNVEKVRGTIVHETFHAISSKEGGPSGLQGLLNDQLFGSTDPRFSLDEAVTDMLAMKAFKTMKPDTPYPTGYAMKHEKVFGQSGNATPKPSMWTGQLVDLVGELDIDFDQIKAAYVSADNAEFTELRGKLVAAKQAGALTAKLDLKRATQAYGIHQVFEQDHVAKVYQVLKEQKLKTKDELVAELKAARMPAFHLKSIDEKAAAWRKAEDKAAKENKRGTAARGAATARDLQPTLEPIVRTLMADPELVAAAKEFNRAHPVGDATRLELLSDGVADELALPAEGTS
jgi:hypothetical protein